MYIIRDMTDKIIAVSDTLEYQSNGNPLIDEGKMAISIHLVDSIEESNLIPEGWEKAGKIYRRIIVHPTSEELRQEGFDECIAMLMEEGII